MLQLVMHALVMFHRYGSLLEECMMVGMANKGSLGVIQ